MTFGQANTTYSWTYGNRLSGANRTGMTASYGYDSEDRRTVKIVNGVMTRTLWSGAEEIAHLDEAGNILRYIIPDGSGQMDGRLAVLDISGAIRWIHTDHQGSTAAVTDNAGVVQGAYAYSPYGESNTTGGSLGANLSWFGYTGREFDAETGNYQYRARYYHPTLGRFLSTDPIGTKDDPNLYGYVRNDPVNNLDSTGRETRSAGSNWVLYPRDSRFPQGISVPRPADVTYATAGHLNVDRTARDIVPGRGSDHVYGYETNIGKGNLADASAAVARNPVTPEGTNNTATPGGTLNGASSPIGVGSNVMTYSRTSADGISVTVNVTVSGEHVFEEGWVMSMAYQNADGTISILTYGEGNSPLQTELANKLSFGFIGGYVENAWARRAAEVRGGMRHWDD